MTEAVRVRNDGAVRTIAICRPESRNALTTEVMSALKQAVLAAGEDASIRALVITGDGGAFSSGLDLRRGAPSSPDEIEPAFRDLFNGLILAIDACPKPTIAFVDGPAAGFGVSIALACDLRVATDRAQFAISFSRIGLCPDGGATWFLPRMLGAGKALELCLLGDKIDATEALRIGLVERVLPQRSAADDVAHLARRLAKGPPLAQRLMKQLCRQHLHQDLASSLESELAAQMRAIRSRDFSEGLLAFLEKREPEFRGE